MAWGRGYIEMACGHRVGTEAWEKTYVQAPLWCPQCKGDREVTNMSRVREVAGSRDFQLGLVEEAGGGDVPDGSVGSAEAESPAP